MPQPHDKPTAEKPADMNRIRRLEAIRGLERLLRKAISPTFRGSIGVELSSKDGRLSVPKLTQVQFGVDE